MKVRIRSGKAKTYPPRNPPTGCFGGRTDPTLGAATASFLDTAEVMKVLLVPPELRRIIEEHWQRSIDIVDGSEEAR
jgi:hypothetical protein